MKIWEYQVIDILFRSQKKSDLIDWLIFQLLHYPNSRAQQSIWADKTLTAVLCSCLGLHLQKLIHLPSSKFNQGWWIPMKNHAMGLNMPVKYEKTVLHIQASVTLDFHHIMNSSLLCSLLFNHCQPGKSWVYKKELSLRSRHHKNTYIWVSKYSGQVMAKLSFMETHSSPIHQVPQSLIRPLASLCRCKLHPKSLSDCHMTSEDL